MASVDGRRSSQFTSHRCQRRNSFYWKILSNCFGLWKIQSILKIIRKLIFRNNKKKFLFAKLFRFSAFGSQFLSDHKSEFFIDIDTSAQSIIALTFSVGPDSVFLSTTTKSNAENEFFSFFYALLLISGFSLTFFRPSKIKFRNHWSHFNSTYELLGCVTVTGQFDRWSMESKMKK